MFNWKVFISQFLPTKFESVDAFMDKLKSDGHKGPIVITLYIGRSYPYQNGLRMWFDTKSILTYQCQTARGERISCEEVLHDLTQPDSEWGNLYNSREYIELFLRGFRQGGLGYRFGGNIPVELIGIDGNPVPDGEVMRVFSLAEKQGLNTATSQH